MKNDVKFEQLISYRPVLKYQPAFGQPPLRDMVFNYYLNKYPSNEAVANDATKEYLDAVYAKYEEAHKR